MQIIASHKWNLYFELYDTWVVITYNETVEDNLKTFTFFYCTSHTINSSQVMIQKPKGDMQKHSNAVINIIEAEEEWNNRNEYSYWKLILLSLGKWTIFIMWLKKCMCIVQRKNVIWFRNLW